MTRDKPATINAVPISLVNVKCSLRKIIDIITLIRGEQAITRVTKDTSPYLRAA